MQTEEQQIKMYGCTLDELQAGVESPIADMLGGQWMTVASMMSDAQELMAMGQNESARQILNRGKWVISNYCVPDKFKNK